MPTSQVLTPPTPAAEPVSLALVNAMARLDMDASVLAAYDQTGSVPTGTDPAIAAEVDLLALFRTAAREKVEAYTNRYYAAQKLALTYELGEPYELPSGATAESVSGFFASLADLENRAMYLVEYQKGISIERQYPLSDALLQTYTVVAATTGDTQFLGLAKRAMLELTAEWFKNRETTAEARGLLELPVSWRVTLAEARVHVLGYA